MGSPGSRWHDAMREMEARAEAAEARVEELIGLLRVTRDSVRPGVYTRNLVNEIDAALDAKGGECE